MNRVLYASRSRRATTELRPQGAVLLSADAHGHRGGLARLMGTLCRGHLPGIGITRGQRFIQFCVITIDIVEKPNLILFVYRSRAVDDQNRNSRGEVHLKIIFIAVHRGLDALQIPARVVSQHPSNQVLGLLYPNASVAEIADILREQFRSICAMQVHVIRIGENDLHQAE